MSKNDAQAAMLEQIRSAFASGQSAVGEDLLVAALDSGVAWDAATRAAAQGVAHRFGAAQSQPPGLASAGAD